MALPAPDRGGSIAWLGHWPGWRRPMWRTALVTASSAAWILSVVYALILLFTNAGRSLEDVDLSTANRIAFHPLTISGVLLLSIGAVWLERRPGKSARVSVGPLLGELTVLRRWR